MPLKHLTTINIQNCPFFLNNTLQFLLSLYIGVHKAVDCLDFTPN